MTWFKDNVPLPASNRFSTQYDLNTGVARLKINDSVLHDAGVYSVVAENKAGSDRTNGRLEIEKETGIDNNPIVNPAAFAYLNKPEPARRDFENADPLSPPRVIVPLSNMQTVEGKPCRFACKIDGHPKPTVNLMHS